MQLPSFVREFTLPPLEWHCAMRAWSKTMRQDQPVCYDDHLNGWRLLRYEDVLQMQNDYKTFSSESVGREAFISIVTIDPPRHSKLRSLVTPAFSARTIAQQTPRVQQIAQELLADAVARGRMDMVADFAVPFPTFRPHATRWTLLRRDGNYWSGN